AVVEGDAGRDAGDVDRQHGVGIDLGERRGDVEGDRGVLIAAGRRGGERRGVGDRGDVDVERRGGGGRGGGIAAVGGGGLDGQVEMLGLAVAHQGEACELGRGERVAAVAV